MIIKTKEFDELLSKNIRKLYINKRFPFVLKGSYLIKENGEYIYDIDYTANVRYTKELFTKIIPSKLSKPDSSFIFGKFVCGVQEYYTPPWLIDFNLLTYHNAIVWIKFMIQQISDKKYKDQFIKVLNQDSLKLSDLKELEEIAYKIGGIHWSIEDMKKGEKIVGRKRYFLIDQVSLDVPVLEMIYMYQNDFCLVDIGLVDNDVKRPECKFCKFYCREWYKIAKSLRWKVLSSFQPEYLSVMREISTKVSIIYYKKMIQLLFESDYYTNNSSMICQSLEDSLIQEFPDDASKSEELLFKEINEFIVNNLDFFDIVLNKFKPVKKNKERFLIGLGIAHETDVAIPKKQLEKMSDKNCLKYFTNISLEDTMKLYTISNSMLFPVDSMIKCVKKQIISTPTLSINAAISQNFKDKDINTKIIMIGSSYFMINENNHIDQISEKDLYKARRNILYEWFK
jgi:hypothetical protein